MENLNLDDLKTALNDFSLNFFKSYQKNSHANSNLFCSPISLASALSLLVAGAGGRTRKELVNLLGYDKRMNNEKLKILFEKVWLKKV